MLRDIDTGSTEVKNDLVRVRSISKPDKESRDILVIDTGGGSNCTIKSRAFHVTEIHEDNKVA